MKHSVLATFLAFASLGLLAAAAGAGPTRSAPSYLYVVVGPEERLAPLPAGVEILGPSGEGTLVRGPAAAVETLAMRGLELVLLDEPLVAGARPPRPAPPPPPPHLTVDPLIAGILLDMSAAEMTANIQRLQDFRTRYSYSDSILAAANYIRDRFAALGLQVWMDPFTFNGYNLFNVVGEKPGSERPDEIYIIGGHYDSIANPPTDAPGADDNGSGTSAVLEAARVMAAIPFEATIRFIAFGGEEQGLIGSRHYVEQHVIPQNEDLRGVIDLDMIAYVHPQYPEWDANWYGDAPVSGALAQHVGQCVQDYTTCVLHLAVEPNPRYGSDHYWFAMHGYPAVFDIDARMWSAPDWNPYYHSANDRLSTLDVPYATEMARGAVAALAELAVPVAATAILDPVASPEAGFELLVGPNPFRAGVAFDVGAETAAVQVVDVAGRVVSELSGSGRLVWQGRDAGGRTPPAGVYFYTVARGGREVSGRLVRVR